MLELGCGVFMGPQTVLGSFGEGSCVDDSSFLNACSLLIPGEEEKRGELE